MRGERSVRRRTTLAAVQEAVALVKVVGAAGVTVAVALHQVGHQASPSTMSVGAVER
jgi:hypothetical protein